MNRSPKFTSLLANAPSYYATQLMDLYNSQSSAHGNSYGDYIYPKTLGSGGGLPQTFNPYDFINDPHQLQLQGAGGGALTLVVGNITMEDTSTISADGSSANTVAPGMAGDGAGGSIFLTVTSISICGSCKITATGGPSSSTRPPMAGGGRIAVHATHFIKSTVENYDVSGSTPGTIYLAGSSSPNNGTLILSNKNRVLMTPDAKGSLAYATVVNFSDPDNAPSTLYILQSASVMFSPLELAPTYLADHTIGDNTGIVNFLNPQPLMSQFSESWGLGFAIHTYDSGTNLPNTLELALGTFFLLDCPFLGLDHIILSNYSEFQFGPSATNYADQLVPSQVSLSSIDLHGFSTLRLRPSPSGNPDSIFLFLTTATLAIDANASLNADGMGYPMMQGPLSGPLEPLGVGTGGGHAGRSRGANNQYNVYGYGDARIPVYAGSGGYPGFTDTKIAGAGGGVISLTITESLTVNGRISANGQSQGVDYFGNSTSLLSGAGGSIYIQSASSTGVGSINADGFDGAASGGRIAIFGSLAGNIQVTADAHSDGGVCGTVYTELSSEGVLQIANTRDAVFPTVVTSQSLNGTNFSLKLSNNPPFFIAALLSVDRSQIDFSGGYNSTVYVAGKLTTFDIPSFARLVVLDTGNVEILSTTLSADGSFSFDINGNISPITSITVEPGFSARLGPRAKIAGSDFVIDSYDIRGNLLLYGSNTTEQCLTLKARTVSIGQSGVLNATGFTPGAGPAPYNNSQHYANHAAYSCFGGTEFLNNQPPIGDFLLPTLMGSGGPPPSVSGGQIKRSVSGGNVWIIAENVTNNGAILVDGQLGGAAGSILIQSQRYIGTGTLSAISTFTNDYGQCSVDGRIALYYNGTGPNATFFQSVMAGSYYEKNFATGTSLVYLNSRPPAITLPSLIPPLSTSDTPNITTIYFNGYGTVETPIHAINVTSINSATQSSILVHDVLTLQTDSVLCSLVPNLNCTIENYLQINIIPGAKNGSSLLVPTVLYNYGFITGESLNVTGQLFLRVGFDGDLYYNGTANGYVPGAVLLNDLTVSPGGQIYFDRILENQDIPVKKRFAYHIAPHAYIHAFNSITVNGGIITSDAEGDWLDWYDISCSGGGSYGPGGGSVSSFSAVNDDDFNPTDVGMGPTNCSGQITNVSLIRFGGGALQMTTQHLILQGGARISASGILGGGGGAVWIQAPLITAEMGSGLYANGSIYPGIAVCGSGGRIAVYSLKNLTAGTDLSAHVAGGLPCPYPAQPSNGSFVRIASPFYFISQTLVFYNFPTLSGGYDFIRFGQIGIMGAGQEIRSYFMPDNYKYSVIANDTVLMESYPPYLGSVQIYITEVESNISISITFFSDWFSYNPTCDSLDVPFSLFSPTATYSPRLYSPDSLGGYTYYSWNNSDSSDPNLKLTQVSSQTTVDGVDRPSYITIHRYSLHVTLPLFTSNATFSFVVRRVGPPTTPPIGNVCLGNNGGCDPRVTCTDLGNGQRTCGPCPEGTSGSGEFLCVVLCGDKYCNATIGENCVTCPLDCNSTTTCGACGDNICDSNEDCSKCPSDCGTCTKPKPCDNNCNHGKCVNGKCACNSPWSGPYCNFPPSQPVNSTLNTTNPGIILDSPTAHFSISIKRIAETDGRTELRGVDIAQIAFTKVEVDSGKNVMNNYTAGLGNGATLNVIVSQFEESTTPYTFAGTTTTYPAHTIKLNINVQNWPFLTLGNSLAVTFDAKNDNSTAKSTTCTNDNENTGNLQWLLLVVDHTSLYVQFLDSALVDGRVRKISFSYNSSDETVSAILPHFWEFSEMDPSYNVLLGDVSTDEACTGVKIKNKSVSKKVIIAVVVPILVFILLAVLFVIFIIPRIKTWMKIRHSTRVPSHNPDMELDSVPSIERTTEYSVNSAAGNFRLEL